MWEQNCSLDLWMRVSICRLRFVTQNVSNETFVVDLLSVQKRSDFIFAGKSKANLSINNQMLSKIVLKISNLKTTNLNKKNSTIHRINNPQNKPIPLSQKDHSSCNWIHSFTVWKCQHGCKLSFSIACKEQAFTRFSWMMRVLNIEMSRSSPHN